MDGVRTCRHIHAQKLADLHTLMIGLEGHMLFYSLCITKFNRTHVIDALLVGGVCGSLPADGGLDILVHDQFVTVKLPQMAYAAFDPSQPLSVQRRKESTIVDSDCITRALPPVPRGRAKRDNTHRLRVIAHRDFLFGRPPR